jgi:hypothetical protein
LRRSQGCLFSGEHLSGVGEWSEWTTSHARFHGDRFAAASGLLDHEAAGAIVYASRGNSYYAQQIAHELFNISTRPRWPERLESAVATALARQSPASYSFWDSIKSRTKRRYLLAAAREGKTTSRSVLIERHGLTSASHVQKAVKQLDARCTTEGGVIVDPVLALWRRGLAERPFQRP